MDPVRPVRLLRWPKGPKMHGTLGWNTWGKSQKPEKMICEHFNGAQICGYRDLPGVSPDMHRATHEFPCLCHHAGLRTDLVREDIVHQRNLASNDRWG